MPKKVIKTETVYDQHDEPLLMDNPMQQQQSVEPGEDVAGYLSQFSGVQSFRVKVYKRTQSNKFAFIFSGGTEIDEELVKSKGGPGEYELRVFVNGLRQDTVSIVIESEIGGTSAAPALAINEISGGGADVNGLRRHVEFLEKLVLNGGMAQQQSSVSELVEAVKALQGLNQGPSPMDLLLKGVELAKEIGVGGGGSGDWKSTLIESARDVVKAVGPAMVAKTTGGELPVTPETTIRAGIAYLKQRAMAGMPVDLVVDWIIGNANDPQYQPFLTLVFRQDFEKFIELDPELAQEPYLSWFRTLHSGLREAYQNAQVGDDDSVRVQGNVRDIGDNARAGKGRVAAK